MSTSIPSRFFNPLALWADVGAKTSDMLLASITVVRIRTDRMLRTALAPSPEDVQEMGLMGQEKVAAATESGAAMVNQMHTTQFALTHRAVRQYLQAGQALSTLMASTSPAQLATHTGHLMKATNRSLATTSQLSSAAARIVQRGLKPVHSRAAANAARLGSQLVG